MGTRAVLLGVVLLAVISLAMRQAKTLQRERDLNACEENLCILGAAVEESSAAHAGIYPGRLEYLAPRYMPEVPHCPVSHLPYSYVANWDDPEMYVIFCSGHHHKALGPGLPAYFSVKGLVRNAETLALPWMHLPDVRLAKHRNYCHPGCPDHVPATVCGDCGEHNQGRTDGHYACPGKPTAATPPRALAPAAPSP